MRPYARAVIAMRALFLVALLGTSCQSGAPSMGFDGTRALEHVRWLADPARGGRLAGSTEYADAARYVTDRLREIGLEPLGDDGTYLQHFAMPLVRLTAMPSLRTSTTTYLPRRDFSEYVSGRAGGGDADAVIGVVGAAERDDFAGADVSGRIALVTNTSTHNPIESAYQHGAIGVLEVGRAPLIQFSYLPFLETRTIPVLQITEDVAEEILAPTGHHLADVRAAVDRRHADASLPPTGFNVDTRVRMSVPLGEIRQVDAGNVVGLLRAPDPSGAARAVMVGAHLDGLGTAPDGTVFPGANDNASGVAIMLEVARTLSARRAQLRHSIVFVAFAGEEEGYLGSAAYVRKGSAVPGRAESLIAFLDADASGCCGDLLGASGEDPSLQNRVRAAVERRGLAWAPVSGGSDQLSFERAHVPGALIQWDHPLLHTLDDVAERVDARHLRGAGEVIAEVALELASAN